MLVTICTATYNRGYILHNLYNSLKKQSMKNFEWILIDDGSTDNTKKLAADWENDPEREFKFIYIHQDNQGKMNSVNRGLDFAHGDLFYVIDSDDYMPDNTVERIIYWAKTIDKNKYAGICGLRCHINGNLIGTTFSGKYIDISTKDRSLYKITGDKAEVWYTELFRKYKFPVVSGEKFITEAVSYLAMCEEEHKVIRFINEPFCYCEYRADGYTASSWKPFADNPQSTLLSMKIYLKYYRNSSYINKLRLKNIYVSPMLKSGKSLTWIRRTSNISYIDLLAIIIGARFKRILKIIMHN
jgi:glycosyltransferase involved in cell wall biosynthesis